MRKRCAAYALITLIARAASYASDEGFVQARIDQDRLMLRQLNTSTEKKQSPVMDKLDDDQTVSSNADLHQPTKQALKFAKKAEREAAKNHHEKAAKYLAQSLAVDPDFFQAENNLALELLALHQPDGAIAHLRHIADTHPERVFPFNNLGVALCQLRRYPEAEAVARCESLYSFVTASH